MIQRQVQLPKRTLDIHPFRNRPNNATAATATATATTQHLMRSLTATAMNHKIIIHRSQITQIRQHNRIQVNPSKTLTVIFIIQTLKHMDFIKTHLMPTITNRTTFHPYVTVTPRRLQQQSLAPSVRNLPFSTLDPRIIKRQPQIMIHHQKEVGMKLVQRRNQYEQHPNQFLVTIFTDVKTKSKQFQCSSSSSSSSSHLFIHSQVNLSNNNNNNNNQSISRTINIILYATNI